MVTCITEMCSAHRKEGLVKPLSSELLTLKREKRGTSKLWSTWLAIGQMVHYKAIKPTSLKSLLWPQPEEEGVAHLQTGALISQKTSV